LISVGIRQSGFPSPKIKGRFHCGRTQKHRAARHVTVFPQLNLVNIYETFHQVGNTTLYLNAFGEVKGKAITQHLMEEKWGEEVYLLLILDLGTRWGEW
jgi:hypothetical protein